MTDRYTKAVLTVIAMSLVYICVALTPMPRVAAQQPASKYPGQSTGPQEVVVVGWKQTTPMQISTMEPLRVITERSSGVADRVVVVGYEESGRRERESTFRPFEPKAPGLPVSMR